MRKIFIPVLVFAVLVTVFRSIDTGGKTAQFSWSGTPAPAVEASSASSAGWLDWLWKIVEPEKPAETGGFFPPEQNCIGLDLFSGDSVAVQEGEVCCRGLVRSVNDEGGMVCRKPLTPEEGCVRPEPGSTRVLQQYEHCCPDTVADYNDKAEAICRWPAPPSSSAPTCIGEGQIRPRGANCCAGLIITYDNEGNNICARNAIPSCTPEGQRANLYGRPCCPWLVSREDALGTMCIAPPAPAESCEMRTVNGIIQRCCRVRYSPFYTCQEFSEEFDRQCEESKLNDCKKVMLTCPNVVNHAMNTVTIDGKKCLVESQGRVVGCTPPSTLEDLLCNARGLPKGCGCTMQDYDNYVFSGYAVCAKTSETVESCNTCCNVFDKIAEEIGPMGTEMKAACQNVCRTLTSGIKYVKCADVSPGFVGECNRQLCRQSYITGMCARDAFGAWLVIDHPCERPAEQCDNPGRNPFPAYYSSSSSPR